MTGRTWARLGPGLAVLVGLGLPTAAAPQRAVPRAAEPAVSYELIGAGPALRVVQGPRFTMAVPRDEPFLLHQAALVLHRNEPVQPGPGGVLLQGWPPGDTTRHAPSSARLVRGTRDAVVAGRAALHYVLRAEGTLRPDPDPWLGPDPGLVTSNRRYELEADLWLLPDIPFSWVTFGAGPDALPRALPGLRTALGPQLDSLGLVGRAEVRLASTDGTMESTAFEIRDLRPAEPVELREPVLDRGLIAALDRLIAMRPRSVCRAARDGDLPGVIESRIAFETRGPLLGYVSGQCRDGFR